MPDGRFYDAPAEAWPTEAEWAEVERVARHAIDHIAEYPVWDCEKQRASLLELRDVRFRGTGRDLHDVLVVLLTEACKVLNAAGAERWSAIPSH